MKDCKYGGDVQKLMQTRSQDGFINECTSSDQNQLGLCTRVAVKSPQLQIALIVQVILHQVTNVVYGLKSLVKSLISNQSLQPLFTIFDCTTEGFFDQLITFGLQR